ncbi:MAG TPA: hypothetical protein VHF22_15340, partial [Planctomycetota bacterium]|nr:hypothetical protein [Planctomycetota bacterium]
MSAAEKLRLRKELEKFYPAVKAWKRDDLVTGRWFGVFLQNSLGAMANPPTPAEVNQMHPGCEGPDDLADDIVSALIREAIVATDAYQENLTGTEIKLLKDKKPGGEQKLAGDTVAQVAEMLYAMKLAVDTVFQVGAAYEKQMNAGAADLFEEAFGKALGAFDYEAAKKGGSPLDEIGKKIFDRAIAQTVGSPLSDAQRKGFYCYYLKALAKETKRLAEPLPKWQ